MPEIMVLKCVTDFGVSVETILPITLIFNISKLQFVSNVRKSCPLIAAVTLLIGMVLLLSLDKFAQYVII
jgi:hypothetical protein